RREAEARAQAQREAELQRQLAEEEARFAVANSGLLGQYVAMIEQRVIRNWNRPDSARPGLRCIVDVVQAPGGTVLSVSIGECNGDAIVRQSIEAAVLRSSPLPPPPDPRLFERNLKLIFAPTD
ncbi:MAG TPA: cell envelope integrity protein TolA, partial [Steroidobacteraceae bacterium]|nr:cell envelope integrity protein TolA [Steroidobacteraceae bacterium]